MAVAGALGAGSGHREGAVLFGLRAVMG